MATAAPTLTRREIQVPGGVSLALRYATYTATTARDRMKVVRCPAATETTEAAR